MVATNYTNRINVYSLHLSSISTVIVSLVFLEKRKKTKRKLQRHKIKETKKINKKNHKTTRNLKVQVKRICRNHRKWFVVRKFCKHHWVPSLDWQKSLHWSVSGEKAKKRFLKLRRNLSNKLTVAFGVTSQPTIL